VSFEVWPGTATAIIGGSGAGKTTILKCINMLTTIDSGKVSFHGSVIVEARSGEPAPIIHVDPPLLRRRIGMVFQEWNLWPNMTVGNNIAAAPRFVRGLSRSDAESLAIELCCRVKLLDKLDSYPHTLSGGQKQRAAIARALAMSPEILMLDEVTSALDPVLASEVLDVIAQLKDDGLTLLVVTHHIDFARAIADHIVFLHEGKVCEEGSPAVLDSPKTTELAGFLKKVNCTH
jgi:ABC-type polar amino acid transport system ATPase subunit